MDMDIVKLCELCNRYYKVAIKKVQIDAREFNLIRTVGERIKYLEDRGFELLGVGSSRAAYLINNQKVLKLAINGKGIAQNQVEFSNLIKNRSDIFPKAYDKAPDDSWIMVEHVRVFETMEEVAGAFGLYIEEFEDYVSILNNNNESEIMKWIKRWEDEIEERKEGLNYDMERVRNSERRIEMYRRALSQKGLVNFIRKMDELNLPFNEVARTPEHWGQAGDGRIVITDAGFTDEINDKLYSKKKVWTSGEDIKSDYRYDIVPHVTDPGVRDVRRYRSKDPRNRIDLGGYIRGKL